MPTQTFCAVEALPYSFPTWPENTYTCDGTFYWAGNPVAHLAPCDCGYDSGHKVAIFQCRDVIFVVEPGFENPRVDRLAAVGNLIRLNPNAVIPSYLTGISPERQPAPASQLERALTLLQRLIDTDFSL